MAVGGHIAIMLLVEGIELQEVSSRPRGGGTALGLPGQSRSVIGTSVKASPCSSRAGTDDILLSNGASQLEV